MDVLPVKAFHILSNEIKSDVANNIDYRYWIGRYPEDEVHTYIRLHAFEFVRDAPGGTNRLVFTLGENKFSLVTVNGNLCDVPGECMPVTNYNNRVCKLNYADLDPVNYDSYPWVATIVIQPKIKAKM